MTISIQAFSEDRTPAVQAFNRRLTQGGSSFEFPEYPLTPWLPKLPGRDVFQDLFLAVEGEHVRGGFILKRQEFSIRGQRHRIAHLKLPISEGIVDKTYASLGFYLLRSALKQEPRLFCLGMGGLDYPLAKMLKSLGWTMIEVPFVYDIHRPLRFLRNIQVSHDGFFRRLVRDVAAVSGIGWAGIRSLQTVQKLRRVGAPMAPGNTSVEILTDEFGDWSDALWERCANLHSFAAVRDRRILNLLYPADDTRFLRLAWQRDGRRIGWSVLLDTPFDGHRQFGAMRVGSLVDGLALPEDIPAVVTGSSHFLRERGVDLLVSNQSHEGWIAAFKQSGFLSGPTNFILALSPALVRMLEPLDQTRPTFHINRGDGDGPINL